MLVWITILGLISSAVQVPIGDDGSLVKANGRENTSLPGMEASVALTQQQNFNPKIVVHPAKDRSIYARRASGIEGVISDIYEVFVEPSNYTSTRGATAVIGPADETKTGPNGYVSFLQKGADSAVTIRGFVKGLRPNGIHGFSIHEGGDLREGCDSTFGHFNPYMQPHGGPGSDRRHVGDLGNIVADTDGVANISLKDGVVSLRGTSSVIGRAVVIHELKDQMDATSEGRTGKRLACGVIGITSFDTI